MNKQAKESAKTDQTASSLPSLWSRRRFLGVTAGGIVGLGVAGLVGYEWPHGTTTPPLQTSSTLITGVQNFVTRPDLRPPTVVVTRELADRKLATPANSPRYIFLAVRNATPGPSQQGLMITDRQGRLVWFKPIASGPFNFNMQLNNDEQRLTWWQGEVINGYGVGVGELADATYTTVKTIHGGDGLKEDLHELNLTSRGTALITVYEQTKANLTSRGGTKEGLILIGHAQEIDLATGKVLFDWSSADHVDIAESYIGASKDATVPYDYFHINSIAETPDGNLLISARNTCAIYKVDRKTGKILWRLNGMKSDFTMGPNTRFYWQHDARMIGNDEISLFDDGSYPSTEKQSRALLLSVNATTMRVDLKQQFVHPAGFVAANQGNAQLLPDGRFFVGWGNQPYFSEFAADGTLLVDGELPIGIRSYRAFMNDWVSHPTDKPAIVAKVNSAGGTVIYVSWNGATEVARWQVKVGTKASNLRTIGSQARSGFETSIAVNSSGPHFAAIALGENGEEIGRTATVKATSV